MSETQAPVAGADPRAWREMAGKADALPRLWRLAAQPFRRTEHAEQMAKLLPDLAAALRDAAEAVTEALAHEAEAARQANTWEELYNAAAARGAEGETERGVLRERIRLLAEYARERAAAHRGTGYGNATSASLEHMADKLRSALRPVEAYELTTLAPRPSAGPAAPCARCGRSYRGQDGPFAGAPCPAGDLCCTPLAVSPAARASDAPAPWTRAALTALDEQIASAEQSGEDPEHACWGHQSGVLLSLNHARALRNLTAPAAPEVPRGE